MSRKFHPTFKRSFDIRGANELSMETILKVRSNPRFCPSLREIADNSSVLQYLVELSK